MTSDDVKNTAKDISDRVGQAASDARASARNTASRAGDAASDMAGQAGDAANDLYGKARDHLRDATDRLPDASEALAAGQRVYNKSSETVGRQISKQPLEALLLAGAIGYLIGWASNRS